MLRLRQLTYSAQALTLSRINILSDIISIGPEKSLVHLVLAHGAGAPMTSPFMDSISKGLAARGMSVHRFEFDYMAARRIGGSRRPPPKTELLTKEYTEVVARVLETQSPKVLYIGGKSLGGRVASLVADGLFASGKIAGVVCLGYPFHPLGKPEKLRTAHLENFQSPALIVQGSRDPFGTAAEVENYKLSKTIGFEWIADGDHDLAPRARTGLTQADALETAADSILKFVSKR
jgi:uncharacterized protein